MERHENPKAEKRELQDSLVPLKTYWNAAAAEAEPSSR